MSTTDLSGAARLLLLLGMQLGRAQRDGTTSPLLPPRGDGSSLLGPVTPGQLLDQSLGLTPGMNPCDDPTSLVDQLLADLFNNGQDNSALSLLNNQSMSDVLAMILALADQADQQLSQIGQTPMCPSRGLGNPFLSGGMPCLNPFGRRGGDMWGSEDGGACFMDWASYMGFAAEFSNGCLSPGANFGYGGACASSMFFGMNAEFGYGCTTGGSYCVGGGHARHRGGGCIGEASMEASFCYSEYCEDYSCEYECEDDDECSMTMGIECDYDDECIEECSDECDDSSGCCVEVDVDITCDNGCDDGGGCEDDC